jgi:sortase A
MKKIVMSLLTLGILAAMSVSAGALDYTIDAPSGPNYGKATSIEVPVTADGGAAANEDLSKNAAKIPPAFGSATSNTLNTGEYLTPNLVASTMAATGTVINGTSAPVTVPGSTVTSTASGSSSVTVTTTPTISSSTTTSTGYTEVTSSLYYSGGYLGTLSIPTLDLSVKIYQGTDSTTLAKGIGHFEETSIWDGNVALAAHNRGTNCFFGEIHTLESGDKIVLTTKLGTRTYAVTSVAKVSETDTSSLSTTSDNCLTLYTCVRDQRDQRWCVRATEII